MGLGVVGWGVVVEANFSVQLKSSWTILEDMILYYSSSDMNILNTHTGPEPTGPVYSKEIFQMMKKTKLITMS